MSKKEYRQRCWEFDTLKFLAHKSFESNIIENIKNVFLMKKNLAVVPEKDLKMGKEKYCVVFKAVNQCYKKVI